MLGKQVLWSHGGGQLRHPHSPGREDRGPNKNGMSGTSIKPSSQAPATPLWIEWESCIWWSLKGIVRSRDGSPSNAQPGELHVAPPVLSGTQPSPKQQAQQPSQHPLSTQWEGAPPVLDKTPFFNVQLGKAEDKQVIFYVQPSVCCRQALE